LEVGLASVIARVWRGATRLADAEAYVAYIRRTGLAEYRATAGNRGAWIMWREVDGRAEFVTLSFWDSEEAIRGFAGDDISRAVFYPEDDRFLISREANVEHYQLAAADQTD
jgi:heme-degrading monooxygenase HmoA